MRSLITAAVAAAAFGLAGTAAAGDVTVELSGVQARGGVVYASLQTREQFLKPTGSAGAMAAAPAAGALRLVIPDVPPGEYSLSVLHDENGDRTMALSASGMPAEGWAMNKGEALRGPPQFDQVKFTVPAEGTTVRATMFYFDGRIPAR